MGGRTITMNHISISLCVLLFLLPGCNASPNFITVSKDGIRAEGLISHKGEQIDVIDIYPDKLSPEYRQNLWIGFSPGKRVPLQAINEDFLKQNAIPSTRYYSNPIKPHYLIDGYDIEIKNGHVARVLFGANDWSPRRAPAFAELGLLDEASLKLPCSVDDLEKVFGKAKIDRSYVE
jgi:hypothetical protein